jgi:phospholipid/cholesterol/gamma-HCH transport system substrate-binding protein
MTEPTATTASRRRAAENRSAAIGLGSLAVVIVLILGILTGSLRGIFSGASQRTIRAMFASTEELKGGAPVKLDGVLVGNVKSISLDPGARAATVTMSVDNSAGPVYADATAVLRDRTVLGGALSVALTRGTATAGTLTGVIPESRTTNQIELEDVTSVVQGGAKQGLVTMPRELAKALGDPAQPARDLATLNKVASAANTGLGALRGQVPDSDLEQLVTATASTMHTLTKPAGDLQSLVSGAAATVSVTGARSGDLRSTIDQAPAALASTRLTLSQLDATLTLADPLISHLQSPAAAVAPSLRDLHPTLTGADQLLRKAVPLLSALRPALTSLASASQQGLPLVNSLVPSLDSLSNTVLPYLNAVDPETQHTAAEMIGPTFEGVGGATGQEDANGHFIRFPVTGGSSPLYLPCQTYFGNPDDQTRLLSCESLQSALGSFLGYNPTKVAGTAP